MIFRATAFVALLILTVEAKKYVNSVEQQEQWQEFEEFLKWKKSKESQEHGLREIKFEERPFVLRQENRNVEKLYEKAQQNPPPVDDGALMGRYIVNQADWASVATISTRKEIESFPVTNLISFSDGPLGNGSGIPYMYLTPLDFTAQDLAKDSRATLMMSLAQGRYCREKALDPMDPRCARIMLSGRIKAIRNGTAEHEIAKNAFFTRHPKLVGMPENHHFFFAKLKISNIAVLDTFGGPKYVNVKEYLQPSTEYVSQEFLRRFPLKEDSSESYSSEYNSDFVDPVVHRI